MTADSRKQVERDILTLKLKNRAKTQKTVSECIDAYIAARSNILSPSTIRGYQIIKRNRFKSIMSKEICDISHTDIQKAINDEAKLVSPKTLRNAWALVRAVLVENNADPGKVLLPVNVVKERAFLEPSVIKKFLKAIKGDRYEIAFLACLHGLRASEMLALDKCDVDSEIRVYKAVVPDEHNKMVCKKMTKNATSTRTVPVFIPRLTELAKKAPEGRLVIVRPITLNRHLRNVCLDNGFEIITLHELRHSFVSLLHFLQISEVQAMSFTGHADIYTMRKIYTHLSNEETEAAKAKLRAFF